MSRPTDGATARHLVLILGVMHRSGTNYLMELLARHPRCARNRLPEDFVVSKLHLIDGYVRAVSREWKAAWGGESMAAELRQAIGRGLEEFLGNLAEENGEPAGRCPLAKTPSVVGLDRLHDYLPDARILALVRDGRAVVESGCRSFGWDFDEAAARWAERARLVLRCRQRAEPGAKHLLVVRYEDLYGDTRRTLRELLAWLGLPVDEYPFERLDDVPVRGSSELAGTGGELHWQPLQPDPGFDPMGRFADWPDARHARFNFHALAELEAFGYLPVRHTRPAWAASQWIRLRMAWRKAAHRARGGLRRRRAGAGGRPGRAS